MGALLIVHILSGGVGLVAGAFALFVRKGSSLHRKSGRIFVYAMLLMSFTGALVAALRGIEVSVVAGLLAAYLVVSALTTVMPNDGGVRWLTSGPMLIGLVAALAGLAWGFESAARGEIERDGLPVPILFVFGTIALLATAADFRLLRKGQLQGTSRLSRHLWRMCFALYLASSSFFLGQADEFPQFLRITPLLIVLALAPLGVMFYWLRRLRSKKALNRIAGANPSQAG